YVVQRDVVKGGIEYRDRLAELQIPLRASHYLPDVECMEESPEYRQEDRSREQIRRVVKLFVPDNVGYACARQRQWLQNYPVALECHDRQQPCVKQRDVCEQR